MTDTQTSSTPRAEAAPPRPAGRLFLPRLALVVFGALLLIVPVILDPYRIFQVTGVLVYAVAALGLVLICGSIGEVSLSHNAFFALGAYTSGILVVRYEVGSLISVVGAAVVCLLVGLIAGYPARRLGGLYLALVTICLALSVTPLIKQFSGITGGVRGLFVPQPVSPANLNLLPDAWIYYFVLLVSVVCFWITHNLLNGSVGRSLSAVREIPLAAASMGINVDLYKVLTMGVGSALAGVGGALFTFSIGFVAPDSFQLLLSISFLAAIVVGGIRTIGGALVAGLFLQFVPSLASDLNQALSGAVYGVILIVVILAMPSGIVGKLQEVVGSRKRA